MDQVDEEFTAFVAAHHSRLLRMADLLVGERGLAEDLLQTVLIKTYLRWTTVRQSNPLGYVRTGLVNARTDWWRRTRARLRLHETTLEFGAITDHAADVVGRDALMRALAVLTARERAVLVLRFYEDLPEAEIARILGIATGTVKSACSRALAKLRISPELAEHSAGHSFVAPGASDRSPTREERS